jgi:hypothetical protein
MTLLNNFYSFLTYESIFVILSTVVNIFFVLYFFGFLKNKNALVENISFYLKIFIGIFLVVKFNPFYTFANYSNKFTNLDKKIVFSAGVYIVIINLIVLYNDYQKKNNKSSPVTKVDDTISLQSV